MGTGRARQVRGGALALYGERGFEKTTVAEIAERAGLTERTFFRHFADKREVLFGGGDALQELIVRSVANAPASLAPIDAAAAGLEAAGTEFFIQERRETSRRETHGRGGNRRFQTAVERWIDGTNDREFTQLVRESLDQVRALTAA